MNFPFLDSSGSGFGRTIDEQTKSEEARFAKMFAGMGMSLPSNEEVAADSERIKEKQKKDEEDRIRLEQEKEEKKKRKKEKKEKKMKKIAEQLKGDSLLRSGSSERVKEAAAVEKPATQPPENQQDFSRPRSASAAQPERPMTPTSSYGRTSVAKGPLASTGR